MCPLVLVVLARGLRAEIPRFFYAVEIAAVVMLLFFRGSVAMDILSIRRGVGTGQPWRDVCQRSRVEQENANRQ